MEGAALAPSINKEPGVTIKLGMFTMPFHHPSRDYATILEEDREAIILADRLGFSEAFVNVYPEYKVGWAPRPFQQPHPPIAISLLTPHSKSARTAGERGWIPVSGNFFHRR